MDDRTEITLRKIMEAKKSYATCHAIVITINLTTIDVHASISFSIQKKWSHGCIIHILFMLNFSHLYIYIYYCI